jgi:hypothetical protein
MFMDEHALRHIFEAEVATYVSKSGKSKTKLHGFHLDYKDEIQTLGIFQLTDVKTFESGAVEANVWYKGIQIAEDKTFFPPTWTREKVFVKLPFLVQL